MWRLLRIKDPCLLSFAIENFPPSKVQFILIKACHSVSFPSIFSGKMIFLMARLSHGNFDPAQLNSAKMKVCIKMICLLAQPQHVIRNSLHYLLTVFPDCDGCGGSSNGTLSSVCSCVVCANEYSSAAPAAVSADQHNIKTEARTPDPRQVSEVAVS